ncbi:MAG: hypothetical protein O7G83_01135 [Proteobacteria bacterium]|nr:hypothetical protein [Pseudomonadota bacterium]
MSLGFFLFRMILPAVWYGLYRTPIGLSVRTAGENPVGMTIPPSSHRSRPIPTSRGAPARTVKR